jgi:RNA polymerase primary sigma factor
MQEGWMGDGSKKLSTLMKVTQNRVFKFKTVKLEQPFSHAVGPHLGRCSHAPSASPIVPRSTASGITRANEGLAESSHGDTFQLYLREIGQVNLLTPEEEIALARRIKRGDKEAREHMIKANLRLVVAIAREYEGLGLPLLDLINEGNIGLMKSVDRFDAERGAKLSTYASWWIKQTIKRALADHSRTIRLPVHVVDRLAHIRRAEKRLYQTLNREPTDEEIAQHLELDPERLTQYRKASRALISLDAPIGDEDSASVADVVADTNASAPFDQAFRDSDRELILSALATLDERERIILAERFGLNDNEPKTLDEIGKHFDLTRERIRQLQELALRKLRALFREQRHPCAVSNMYCDAQYEM